MQSTLLKKNLLLLGLLVITTIATVIGVRYFIFAKGTAVPAGYSVLSYFNALEVADKNSDGYINSVDSALTIKRYGSSKIMAGGQFGTTVGALERSFQLENLNVNIAAKKAEILANEENKRRYTQDLVVANESLLPVPQFVKEDKAFNQSVTKAPTTLANTQTTTSGSSGATGGGTSGSKGADSGKTIIPSVLGTVSSYTGSAGFDYPIAVPAGPGGIAPALSLSYSSGNVDDTLGYDDRYAEKQRDSDGTVVNSYRYKDPGTYVPFYAGYGFNIGGAGSITRDTRGEKDVYVIKGDIHHRFLLNLPSGLSVELKYNNKTRRWVSVPEGFVKIEHAVPAVADERTSYGDKEGVPASLAGIQMPGSDYKLVDADEWVVTASDGSKYYFGEKKLQDKISADGGIHGRDLLKTKTTRKLPGRDEETYEGVHHAITNNGGIFNEYDIADVCTGGTSGNPCHDWHNADGKRINGRFEDGKPVLLTTKWLLRRMETSDGRAIDYTYDNYQKYYGEYYPKDWNNKLAYATVDSYLKEVSWNDNKHRVVLTRESRPDVSDRQFTSMQRLSKIDVQTKLQADDKFHTVRRYILGYANDDKAMEPSGGRNEWGASLLSSIQELGTDADTTKTKTPPVTFQYKAYGFEDGPSGSTIYLSSINNGYGGETKYAYQPFTYPLVNGVGDVAPGPRRLRVIEKKVVDKTSTPNKSFRETYNYKDANGNESSWGFADRIRGEKRTGREFLGHSQVEIKSYDFDSSKVLSHSKTQFFQFNATLGNKVIERNCQNGECNNEKVQGFSCFEPNMNKGRPSLEIVYNQLPGGGEIEASRNEVHYNYRTLAWDAANNGTIKEDKLDVASKKCDGIGMAQPYFVYAKDTVSTVTEPANAEFNKTGVLANLKETPVNTKTVKSENLAYDLFGNLLQSVSYGEVDAKKNDIDPKDNRYSFGYYLTGNPNWLNNLAYVMYSSNKKDCAPGDFSCQYGRSEMWYDRFYTDQPEIKIWEQKPSLGLVTQTKSFIETDANHDNKHDDPIVAYAGTEYLRLSNNPADQDTRSGNDTSDQRRGGATKVYGPKPNIKSVDDVNNQTMLLSQTHYDDYYHTLVDWTQNALGHTTKLEDYDYLLQAPRKSLTQISKNPDVFSASRVTFDPLGRAIATFGPHPADPSKTADFPQSVSAQFDDRGDAGLATRQLALVSQTNDGAFHYIASDSFYDGMGKVKQTQVLSKKIDGAPKRLVSDAVYNAAGQQIEQFESQVTDPVTLGAVTSANYNQVIRSNQPSLATIPHTVVSKTEYDGLNRPVQSTVFDTSNNTQLTTRTAYYVNAQKAVNPKGVTTITTMDAIGRPSDALVIDPTGDQHSIVQNVYGQAMIDKPTTTTYRSLKNLEGGSSATTYVTYDKSGRILSSDEPSLGKSEFTYDVLGNVINLRREAREDIVSKYDVLGRLVQTQYADGSNDLFNKVPENKSDINYVYDTAPYALGKLVSVTHHMGKDEFTYDTQGRQIQVKKTIGDKSYATNSSFNALSQVTKVTYPDNNTYEMLYDNEGTAQQTKLNGELLATGTVFDKNGNATSSQFVLGANTYVSKTQYDKMGRLTNLDFVKKASTGDQPYFSQALKYDQFAQLSPLTETTYKDGVKEETQYNYTYDSFARLTKADSNKFNTSYAYDPFGRIQAKNEAESITYAYNSSFPYFAPKSITIPSTGIPPIPEPTIGTQTFPTVKLSPTGGIETNRFPSVTPKMSVTPTTKPKISSSPTPTTKPRATSIPLPTPKITAKIFLSPTPLPTSAPMSCMFEPIAAIKEKLSDGTLKTLSTEDAANFLTINDMRKAKYDVDSTKKEFWNGFIDGFLKACPAGGCDMKDKELCCVDEKNELPYAYKVGEKGFTGKIQPLIARATIYLKDFSTGSSKFTVVGKYCTNAAGADGCPPDTNEVGGLREPGIPTTEIRNVQIGCNKRYEYGWIVQRTGFFGSLFNRFFPAKQGIAEEKNVPPPKNGVINFSYNKKGALLEDDKQCYTYNRLNQLIAMKIKKTSGQTCASADFIKTVYFYYDYAGTLVLQEEYKPNASKPAKQTYYFGSYEDEYTNE